MIYEVTVKAMGYETLVACKETELSAKQVVQLCVTEWLELNAIDEESRGLAFVKVKRIKG